MSNTTINIKTKYSRLELSIPKIDIDVFKQTITEANQAAAVEVAAQLREELAKGTYYQNRTGNLTDSNKGENNGFQGFRIYNNMEYAPYVNYGTGIYATKGAGRSTPWTYYSESAGQYYRTQGQRATNFFEPNIRKIMQRKIVKDLYKTYLMDWWIG